MFAQAAKMVQGKNNEQLKQTAQNICNQKGIDLQQAFEQFSSMFNYK